MSNAVFPTLPGLDATYKKTPEFNTLIHASVTGKELRIGQRIYPMWNHELKYNFMRSTAAYPELQQLGAFYLARSGPLESFLFQDAEDCSVVDQPIGVGDGVETQFQLVRGFGTYVEPTFYPDVITNVKLDGVETAVTQVDLGEVVFAAPPAIGQRLTSTFTYWYRSRFAGDTMEFEHFMWQLWSLGKCPLRSSLQDKLA